MVCRSCYDHLDAKAKCPFGCQVQKGRGPGKVISVATLTLSRKSDVPFDFGVNRVTIEASSGRRPADTTESEDEARRTREAITEAQLDLQAAAARRDAPGKMVYSSSIANLFVTNKSE